MLLLKPNFWDKNRISLFSILLYPITLLIKLLSLFKQTLTKTRKFSIPIICVGNIYIGGTGKTPLCIEIFSILKKLNHKPVFIRKKYDEFQDEIKVLRQVGSVYENKKRTKAIEKAIQNGAEVAILDDGLQDFSVDKNLSIVCFNEKQWVGNGFTIPSGPLRENLSALKRANYVCINGEKNTNIEKKILNNNKKIKIFYTKYIGKNINDFKNKKIIAFAGIGNPINFFDLLKENNINLIKEIKFPDHHNYQNNELENLINESKKNNAILLTTEKDFLRIDENYKLNINFLKIMIEMKNHNQFVDEIKKIV
tara:strand:+ start:364 stop:1293 length:930 start_codon:yes stop_codon:yes gene_type:complete